MDPSGYTLELCVSSGSSKCLWLLSTRNVACVAQERCLMLVNLHLKSAAGRAVGGTLWEVFRSRLRLLESAPNKGV